MICPRLTSPATNGEGGARALDVRAGDRVVGLVQPV
jgi:hypothetical protein